jgi:hypothetical protein
VNSVREKIKSKIKIKNQKLTATSERTRTRISNCLIQPRQLCYIADENGRLSRAQLTTDKAMTQKILFRAEQGGQPG